MVQKMGDNYLFVFCPIHPYYLNNYSPSILYFRKKHLFTTINASQGLSHNHTQIRKVTLGY